MEDNVKEQAATVGAGTVTPGDGQWNPRQWIGSEFEAAQEAIGGVKFAQFHLSGSQDVTVYAPYGGSRNIALEIVSGVDWRPGGPDSRRRTVLHLPKSRARAVASAIMGAAAEQ